MKQAPDRFNALFEQFYVPLCHYAAVILNDDQLAEDIVQNLFIQLWENKAYQNIKKPEQFLLRSTKFKCIDHLRGTKKEVRLHELPIQQIADTPSPLELAEEDILPTLHYFAASLPPKTQEVFLLSRAKGHSNKEIANMLKISIKTVENQMTRALRLLRELLRKADYLKIFSFFFMLK